MKRKALFKRKIVPEVSLNSASGDVYPDVDLSTQNIRDSQLQMMFAICHPCIPAEAQIGLSLRILCGFGIEEIADAFLTTKEAINKRLYRAKEKLREEKIKIEIPNASGIGQRLSTVLTTIYLLFSEGYYSESQDQTLRKELCFEAMRLCEMLLENALTNTPDANALISLMYFHASRFDARVDENGELILYNDQDASLWNFDLINKGAFYLHRAATGNKLSKYHLEAAIAYWHTRQDDTTEKWDNILQLYNSLLQMEYSPIAALNRTYALSKVKGNTEAIAEAEKLKLSDNHFYHSLLGELYIPLDRERAISHFQLALKLARSPVEKAVLRKKLELLAEEY